MAWETRKGQGRYYTRSRKVNGQVIREYLGTGFGAEAAAQLDAYDQAERAAQQMRNREAMTRLRDLDATMDAAFQQTQDELTAALQTAGYHQHKRGEWRKRREDTSASKAQDA